MMSYVLDTSVAVAWYLPEVFSDAARTWQRRLLAGEIALLVPSLHYWELANVLRTYVRRGELDEDVALEAYHLHLEAPLSVTEPERREVLRTALRYQATAYDAVYVALVLETKAALLTAEKTTRPWIGKLGKRVIQVRALTVRTSPPDTR